MCLLWITKKLQLIEKYFSDTSTARLWSLLSVRKDSLVWNYRAIYSGYIGFCLISISLQTKKLQQFEISSIPTFSIAKMYRDSPIFFYEHVQMAPKLWFRFSQSFLHRFQKFFFSNASTPWELFVFDIFAMFQGLRNVVLRKPYTRILHWITPL